MRTKQPPRIDVVKKEDKEAHLVSFIRADMATVRARAAIADTTPAAREFTLVVRSLQSPAATALTSLAAELRANGVSLRIVVAQSVLGAEANLFNGAAADLLPIVREVRLLRDLRFLDAHEQLCLDRSSIWVGDSMRREPGKRDAYESYAADNDAMATWATCSFERLWAHALRTPERAAPAVAEQDLDVCPAALTQQGEPVAPVEAATRH